MNELTKMAAAWLLCGLSSGNSAFPNSDVFSCPYPSRKQYSLIHIQAGNIRRAFRDKCQPSQGETADTQEGVLGECGMSRHRHSHFYYTLQTSAASHLSLSSAPRLNRAKARGDCYPTLRKLLLHDLRLRLFILNPE